jgi:hypothetical protein
VDRGRNVLHRLYLGANEILQMAGRVHGRVAGGEVFILSDRDLAFDELRPGPPEFQLAGDAERVAITCAALGVDARDLDLPVPLDRAAYRRAVDTLTRRALVEDGRLTAYGRAVEAMPVERPWGELLVHADADLVPIVAVCSTIESLHRMTREERDLHGALVNGSDHLTAYSLYAEAVNHHGYVGEVYGLPRHLFQDGLEAWAERRGVLVKAIEDAALGTASVYRSLELPLPARLPHASRELRQRWSELLARVMPFDLVIDERTADGQEARVSKTSVAGSWGAVAGNLRYFADRFGVPRAGIEGTTLPYELIRRFAVWGPPRVSVGGPRRHQRLAVSRDRSYFGFQLETETDVLEGDVPPALRAAAADALTEAVLGDETVHSDQGRLRRAVAELDELWRRSGGTLPTAGRPHVHDLIRAQLDQVTSWESFLGTRLRLEPRELVDEATTTALQALPSAVRVKGDTVALDYDVEGSEGIVRLRLREGQARRLEPGDLPAVDRPLRFEVGRGNQPPLRASTLPGLKAELGRAVRREPRDRRRARRAPGR